MSDENSRSSDSHDPVSRFTGLPKRVTALLRQESDRSSILILGAYLDEILGLIVRAACTSDRVGASLLEYRRPAGDFNSRILMCEAFGLISPDEAKSLHALRAMRNDAAHFDQDGRGFDVLFDSPKTVARVRTYLKHLNVELRSVEPAKVRSIFDGASRLLAAKLLLRLARTRRPPVAPSSNEEANRLRAKFEGTERGRDIAEAERRAHEGDMEPLFELLRSSFETARKHPVGEQNAEGAE